MRKMTMVELEKVRSIATAMSQDYWKLNNFDDRIARIELSSKDCFWDELEDIIAKDSQSDWKKREDAVGEAYEQYLGSCEYEGETHTFSYIYMGSSGTIFDLHNHNNPKDSSKKTKEWYIFLSNGKIEFCAEDEEHCLINHSDVPDYVLSIKVTRSI